MVFDQISKHAMAQESWHMELTITVGNVCYYRCRLHVCQKSMKYFTFWHHNLQSLFQMTQNDVLNGSLVFERVNYFWRESSGSFVYIVFYNLQGTFTYISTFDQSVPLFSKLWLQVLPPSYWLCLTQAKRSQGSNHYAVNQINRVKPVWATEPNTVLSLIETYFAWIMWANASVCTIFSEDCDICIGTASCSPLNL